MEEFNEKLIARKQQWAQAKRGMSVEEGVIQDHRTRGARLPPGQHPTKGWPVLDLGLHPTISLEQWSLSVVGLVEYPLIWSWNDFLAQPHVTDVSDFHCVTTWSTFDNTWEGVSFRHIMKVAGVRRKARFVFFTSYDQYTTNLPLEACDDEDVLLARLWNGQPLSREHGGPVRMIVPKRYAWKGAKWIKEVAFLEQDRLGYWEVRGYSNTAKPWEEDRYA